MNQEIIEEVIRLPSPNAIHYYVNSIQDEDVVHNDEDVDEEPPTQDNNISTFLKLLQEVVMRKKPRVEALVDYSQVTF